MQKPLAIFFASCVVIAGIYGGLTVTRRIMIIQAVPADDLFGRRASELRHDA